MDINKFNKKDCNNKGEAADAKANGYQYRNKKDGQKAFAHYQSLGEMSYGYKARDHGYDDKNEKYVGSRGAYVSHPSTMRMSNSMLKAWNNVRDPKRQYDLSYQRSNNEHLMFGSLIKSASHRHKNMKAGILSTSKLYDDKGL
ncbi:24385_t:CDS:2 [Gigaspora rosea]|nr:24385_t:CDS:2 [Gigaspora rosea]